MANLVIDDQQQISDQLLDLYAGSSSASSQKVPEGITAENLSSLLRAVNFDLVSFRPFTEGQGHMNTNMYLVTASDCSNQSQQDFVLKFINDTPLFGSRTYEPAVMQYVREKTQVPVPRVLSHCKEASASPIGCGYMLMERVQNAVPLCDLYPREKRETEDLPEKIYEQLADIHCQLRALDLKHHVICYLDERMQPLTLGIFGPTFDTYWQYIDTQLTVCMKFISIPFKRYSPLFERLEAKWSEFRSFVEAHQAKLNGLNFDDPMCLDHGDLNLSNIFVNPKTLEVKALIDWECATFGYEELQSFVVYDLLLQSQQAGDRMFEHLDRVLETRFKRPQGLRIRRYLRRIQVALLHLPVIHKNKLGLMREQSQASGGAQELHRLQRAEYDRKMLAFAEYFDSTWDNEMAELRKIVE